MLIAERFTRVFTGNDAADLLFDALAGDVLSVTAFEPALKEKFQLEQSLRRMHILIAVARLTVDSCM